MKKYACAAIVSIMLLCLCLTALCEEAQQGKLAGSVFILHTNDVRGHAAADEGTWGYGAVSRIKRDLEAQGAEVLLTDGGNFSQGTPLVNMDSGATAVDFLNAAAYDVVVPGTHDFDWGRENLVSNMQAGQFTVVCANLLDSETGETVFAANAVFDKGSHRIGIFGLLTPDITKRVHPDKLVGMTVLSGDELLSCAQEQVNLLRSEGCDIVICLASLGTDNKNAGFRSTDVIAGVSGIDLFLDGYSGEAAAREVEAAGENGKKTCLVQAGEAFSDIGVIRIDTAGEISAIVCKAPSWDTEPLTMLYRPDDAVVEEIVASRQEAVADELSQAFAVSSVLLDGEKDSVRTKETNLGDFCADAILWVARSAYGEAIDCAVINSGSVRASVPVGSLTMLDLKTVFPYDNDTIVILSVTGQELLDTLNAATAALPESSASFPQVSGIVFSVDTHAVGSGSSNRLVIESVGDKPFSADATYLIATNDYLAAGGDGYTLFCAAYRENGYNTGSILNDALSSYVTQMLGGEIGPQYAEPAGRITID